MSYVICLFSLVIGLLCCNAQATSHLRLVGGAFPSDGRVEVNLGDGRGWGTICDNGWDYHDAAVVCKQIGYPAATFSTLGDRFGGNPALPVLLENVACTSSHSTIDECPSAAPSLSCDHANDAGVKCMFPSFLGCFSILTIGSRAWTILDNSNDACIAHCKALDYRYAGMSGSSCRCGNTERFYFFTQFPDFYCNTNCKGDATQLCGNPTNSRFSVFDTTLGVCEDPGVPQNGNRTGDDFEFGTTVEFSCHEDHVLMGHPILQCVLGNSPHDVKWNGTVPECVISAVTLPGFDKMDTTTTIPDVTIAPMTSPQVPTARQNGQPLSSGAIAGIAVVLIMSMVAFVILAVLYCLKKKRKAKERASEFHPESLNQKSDSAENVYEIEQSNVIEDETELAPSTTNGHAVVPGNVQRNIDNRLPPSMPRALPSIHLYADVTLPREDVISPTSDYDTMNDVVDDNGVSPPLVRGENLDETGQHNGDKSFYFVLENAVPNDLTDKRECPTQKPEAKPRAPAGRFAKKPPRAAPRNVKNKANHVASATNVLKETKFGRVEDQSVGGTSSARVEGREGEIAAQDLHRATSQNEPQCPETPKYANSEFQEIRKNLIENTLYKPLEEELTDSTGIKQKLTVPNLKTRLRNNSESEATQKSPVYANYEPKRRRSTGEPNGRSPSFEHDDGSLSVQSSFYINAEFHSACEVPENMIENPLYKPCTPGLVDSLVKDNS
ncbi:uncharacterized protein LOC129279861 [Lytechinus pictus]|uniref:uncharacterized protein LOC129279861 n=1 Tax=Lytechinus pictus TaxID=7653 RepID=UPI0030BA0932